MKKGNVKITSIFQTKEQEELFARCAQKTMFEHMNYDSSYFSIDESMCNGKIIVSPVFQTKEQEELFARCAQKIMFEHMNDEVSLKSGKQKTLKK